MSMRPLGATPRTGGNAFLPGPEGRFGIGSKSGGPQQQQQHNAQPELGGAAGVDEPEQFGIHPAKLQQE